MNKQELQALIEESFQSVTLEDGMSILQTQIASNYGEGYTDEEFDALPQTEITSDWKAIPLEDLNKLQAAFLDGKGVRYYIPALMLSMLNTLDPASWISISTLCILTDTPGSRNAREEDYYVERYSAITPKQLRTMALFIDHLPKLLPLDERDKAETRHAIERYWHQYL